MTPGMTAKVPIQNEVKKSFRLARVRCANQTLPPRRHPRQNTQGGPLKTLKYVSPGKAGSDCFANSFDTITTSTCHRFKTSWQIQRF